LKGEAIEKYSFFLFIEGFRSRWLKNARFSAGSEQFSNISFARDAKESTVDTVVW